MLGHLDRGSYQVAWEPEAALGILLWLQTHTEREREVGGGSINKGERNTFNDIFVSKQIFLQHIFNGSPSISKSAYIYTMYARKLQVSSDNVKIF